MNVPEYRIRPVNDRPLNLDGRYVLYWMIAARRAGWNFALQRAVEMAVKLARPLVVFEALSCDYPYASDRLHRFILQGMTDNARALEDKAALYYPYVEPESGAGKGLVVALSVEACLIVTDDFPAFFLSHIVEATGRRLPMRFEAVDGNGLLPMRIADHAYPTAYAFRRFLQKTLPRHLMSWPSADPLAAAPLPRPVDLPGSITDRWADASEQLLSDKEFPIQDLPIDHAIAPTPLSGGSTTATELLHRFLDERLDDYAEERNHPDANIPSGLSPYLHFGHISSHAVFAAITDREEWHPHELSHKTDGKRTGWWHMSANAEAFLDQLVTWRELGYNMCCHEPDRYKAYDNLPDWARKTLAEHADDHRPYCYSYEQFRDAQTHDPLWNAAQRQLLREGTIHNYLRMLWGKKILEWSPTPQAAVDIMIDLNDRYALDGRDPNSYSGIFWCLGRYDRGWGPIRPIFGSVRYMSSENTQRKVKVKEYLERYR